MSAQVSTTYEGESEFKFDAWINKNGLREVKDIFIKHDAVNPLSLSLSSAPFHAVMSDPKLLTEKAFIISKIILALQCVPDVNSTKSTKQRIVITEAEETAMTNAQSAYEKVNKDIQRFDELMVNTNENYKENEKLINDPFDEMVNALRKRQKQLLTQLQYVQKQKVGAFVTQLNVLKGYTKEYNDLNHKWNALFDANNMERNNRKQQIVNECNGTIAKAQNFQEQNKRIFRVLSDTFSITFDEYTSFVQNIGNISSDRFFVEAPIMTMIEKTDVSAKFTIKCEWDGHDDEKKGNLGYVYEVEWRESKGENEDEDDEKCQWKKKEFISTPIQLDGLCAGKRYGVKCKQKLGQNMVSAVSKIQWFTTKMQVFELQRGGISGGTNWGYGGRINALCFTSNKDIYLCGIGVFDCEGTVNVKYKIFRGDNDKNNANDGNIIAESQQKSFTKDSASNTPIRFDLDESMKIEKGTKYTVQLVQKNDAGNSYRINAGKRNVNRNGITITFSDATYSPNSTDVSKGAFPILYCGIYVS